MPEPYLTRAALAKALMIGESTVDDMVRRGVIPRPVKLSSGCVRWRWETVDRALASLQGAGEAVQNDDIQAGISRALEAAKGRRRAPTMPGRK